MFIDSARSAKAKHLQLDLTLWWVPGHLGVDGNVMTDDEAKEVAHGHSSAAHLLPPSLRTTLSLSAAKARQGHLTTLQTRARLRDKWHRSRRGVKLKKVCRPLHTGHYVKVTALLS